MNVLPIDKQVEIVAALTEGVSIRAIERMTGVHRDTIMLLGVRIGEGCAGLHDVMMADVQVGRVELDEAWSYVAKKQRKVPVDDTEKGDQYVFLALEGTHKAILSYAIGKRDIGTTRQFIADLRCRLPNRPVINSDAFTAYPDAIEEYFGADVSYSQIGKHYSTVSSKEAARRYSPGHVVAVETRAITGRPRYISTSYIERQNLNLRRFIRLTNGFSKELRNHKAAVALYVAHYNLCRVHETLRITPAMAQGLTDHIWSVEELIATAGMEAPITDRPRFGPSVQSTEGARESF